MNLVLRRLLVSILCINLTACTTLRGVPDWQPSAASASSTSLSGLKPGDRIVVTTAGNQSTKLVFVSLTTDSLEGRVGKNKPLVQIPRDQILLVERREFSMAKTAGLAAGVLLALLVEALGRSSGMPGY